MSNLSSQAVNLYGQGFNCAQSVLCVFANKYDMNVDKAYRIGSQYGDLKKSANMCDALTGAVMVIGLKYGQYVSSDKEGKVNCYKKTVDFINCYKKIYGTAGCKNNLNCGKKIKETVELLEKLDY